MIHIMRENETLPEVCALFKTDISETLRCNTYKGQTLAAAGSAVWLPADKRIQFNEITDEMSEYELTNKDYFVFSALCQVDENENSFIPADLWGRTLSEIYIDGYAPKNDALNLPYDYPAINACLVNNVKPSFAIKQPGLYLSGDMTSQLLHDLSFKEYDGGLIIAENDAEAEAAVKLASELTADGYEISLAANGKTMNNIKFSGVAVKRLWYMTEKNTFDFPSFEMRVKKLLSLTDDASHAGVLYTPRLVRVRKNPPSSEYITAADVAAAMNEYDVKKVFFDETSQLNIFTVTDEKYGETSYVYEDMRSLYAKCALLKEYGIRNICFNPLNEEIPRFVGAAYLASDNNII